MKIVKQFGIILFITLLGEVLHHLIPLPVPASIYGMLIMLLCLRFKIIEVSDVKETSYFLLEAMPIVFIPAAAGIITAMDVLKNIFIAYAVTAIASTLVVMIISGAVTQLLMNRKNAEEKK